MLTISTNNKLFSVSWKTSYKQDINWPIFRPQHNHYNPAENKPIFPWKTSFLILEASESPRPLYAHYSHVNAPMSRKFTPAGPVYGQRYQFPREGSADCVISNQLSQQHQDRTKWRVQFLQIECLRPCINQSPDFPIIAHFSVQDSLSPSMSLLQSMSVMYFSWAFMDETHT